MLKGKERSRGEGALHNKQLRQLRTCGHVARTVCTVGFRVSPAMTGTFECPHPLPSPPTATHMTATINVKCCRVRERERERERDGHTCIDYYLPLATWHLQLFSASFFLAFSTTFGRVFPRFFLCTFHFNSAEQEGGSSGKEGEGEWEARAANTC